MFVLQLISAMLRADRPFGLIDAKGDLFERALFLIFQFPGVWERVVIIDFSNRDVVSPYNILVPQGDDLDYFLTRRLETVKELLPAKDKLSLRGTDLLRHVVALLAELRLPVTHIERALTDAPQGKAPARMPKARNQMVFSKDLPVRISSHDRGGPGPDGLPLFR